MAHFTWWRVLLAILLPPLSVLDIGIGWFFLVLILWLLGWVPGVIAALLIIGFSEDKPPEIVAPINSYIIKNPDLPLPLPNSNLERPPVVINPDDKYTPASPQDVYPNRSNQTIQSDPNELLSI